jgi:hypothetical protein
MLDVLGGRAVESARRLNCRRIADGRKTVRLRGRSYRSERIRAASKWEIWGNEKESLYAT